MSAMDKPSDGVDHAVPTTPPDNMPIDNQDATSDEDAEQTPSEVAMRISLLGRLVIPPSNP